MVIAGASTIIANLFSVIELARQRLRPSYVLVSNAVSLTVWTVLLIVSFVAPPGWDIFAVVAEGILM